MNTGGRGLAWAAAILLGLMLPVQADYESGVKAYRSGDYETALGEFARAAESGDRNAQYNVGLMHLKGEGVAINDQEAVRWFRKAARLGQGEAQTFLGALYADGRGVTQDYEQAAHWLAMAAEAGHGAAQCFLGQLYVDGLGVEEDPVEAYAWFSVSELNGYPEAAGLLKQIAASMSPGDIERARRLAQVRGPNWARQGEGTPTRPGRIPRLAIPTRARLNPAAGRAVFATPSPATSPTRPMMRVTDQLAIRAQDLSWRFVRAPGPGGQNVNKVATAVELRFDTHSPALPEPVRLRLRALAGRRIGKHGMLLIEACRHRTQARNREDALERLWGLLSQAAATPKRRIATRPSASSKRLRVETKRRQAAKKQSRRTPFAEP